MTEEHIPLQESDIVPEAPAAPEGESGPEMREPQLERGVEFVDVEMQTLAAAAAERAASDQHDPSRWQRAARKAKARIVASGLALMTLAPLAAVTPKAEAGEGGRRAARIGAEVLWQGDQLLYEEHMRKMEEARAAGMAAEEAEWSMQQMELHGEDLLRRYEELSVANDQVQAEVDQLTAKEQPTAGDARRVRYLAGQQGRLQAEMATIKARLVRLDGAMNRADARAQAAGKAAEQAEKSARKMRRIGAGARILGGILGEIGRR